jgi:predicted  nucleic acid-binding Zn-ribbon protein
MYNDNVRQINILQDSNLQIRRTLTEILSNRNNINHINHINNIENINRYNNSYYNNLNNRENRPINNLNSQNNIGASSSSTYTPGIARNNAFSARNTARTARESASYIRNRNVPSLNLNRISPSLNNYMQRFFEPIEIYPTQTQIENATRIVSYRDIVEPTNNSCPISLEPFSEDDTVAVIRQCGHIFRQNQLIQWFSSNCRCPVCRYDIRNYVHSENNNNNNNNTNQSEEDIHDNEVEENNNSLETDTEQGTGPEPEPEQQETVLQRRILDSLSDILINTYANNNIRTNNMYETIFFDIILDASYNTNDINNEMIWNYNYNLPNRSSRNNTNNANQR